MRNCAGNGIGNGGSGIQTSSGKSWAEDAGKSMANSLSPDACGMVLPVKEGGVVTGSLGWFCFSGGVQFNSSFFEDGGQCFWFVTSVKEVDEEGRCMRNIIFSFGVLFPETLKVAKDQTLQDTGWVC